MENMSKPSQQHEIIANNPKREACGLDYSSYIKSGLTLILLIRAHRLRMHREYGIFAGGYDMLSLLIAVWVNEHRGMSAYQLCEGHKSRKAFILRSVVNLKNKGLLTIIGRGFCNCNVYAPTDVAMKEFIDLCRWDNVVGL